MTHMARLILLSTCLSLIMALSQSTPLQIRLTRRAQLCASCKDEASYEKAVYNCSTNQQRSLQDAPCHGQHARLGTSPSEKSTIRQKRCTAEELYQLREKIEATKRNIERLRNQKNLPVGNFRSVYYPRQVPSVHPLFTPLEPGRIAMRQNLGLLNGVGNPQSWQRGPGVKDNVWRPSLGDLNGAGNPRPWQRVSADREESPRPWRRLREEVQEPQDINDSVAPRRHVERAPLSVPEITTADPIEFLQNRRQLLEENLQMLLKNFNQVSTEKLSDEISKSNTNQVSTEKLSDVISKSNNASKQLDDLMEDLNEHPRAANTVTTFNRPNKSHQISTTAQLGNISMTAQFHTQNDIVKSAGNINNTLSQKLVDISGVNNVNQTNRMKNVLKLQHIEKSVQGSAVSNHSHIVGSISKTDTTAISEPATDRDTSTRKRLDVIVDIAVMPNSRGNTESWVTGQVDSIAKKEEERRKNAFVSQHTPHTLSPPIVLDSNPGFRISRNQEDESYEGGSGALYHNDLVPSVSKVFILKSFKSENANFGIPKAQDLFLHKKSPSVFSN